MKKHLKWIIPSLCIVLAAAFVGGYYIWKSKQLPTKISYIHSDSPINRDDPREVVGAQSYVFVGYVEETHDYMTEKGNREFPKPVTDSVLGNTECVVKVIKSIKGNIVPDTVFSFYKVGGVSEDGKCIDLFENDVIPEAGKYYIFTGFAHEDGTVTGGGENGTIEIEEGIDGNNLVESEIYQKYVDAYRNQILLKDYNFPRYFAQADANYGDGSYNEKLREEYSIYLAGISKRSDEQMAGYEKSAAR